MSITYNPDEMKAITTNINSSLNKIIAKLKDTEKSINSNADSWGGTGRDKLFSKLNAYVELIPSVITKAEICIALLNKATNDYVTTDEKAARSAAKLKNDIIRG